MSGRTDEWPEERIQAQLEEVARARATCISEGECGEQ